MRLNRAAIKKDVRSRFQTEGMHAIVSLFFIVFLIEFPFSMGLYITNIKFDGTDILESGYMILRSLGQIFFFDIFFVGLDCWMLRYAQGENPPKGVLFGAFRFYGKALGLTVKRGLLVAAWSCLLIVPGIVKAYAYSFSNYILCENPAISAGKALDMSIRITKGHKKDLFLLDLSFLGWIVLQNLTIGLSSTFYSNPYSCSVKAQYYLLLKQHALSTGAVEAKEFKNAAYHKPYV